MPPHLHPRSRMTSSLFATAVAASFFVVALPHMLPCPAPRVKYADCEVSPDGTRRRRRRRPEPVEVRDELAQFESSKDDFDRLSDAKAKRECPVPKPGGVIGELMGFRARGDKDSQQQQHPRDEQ
ncbi:hypothetical protein PG990_009365 [Apiospora arundinis]